MSDQAQQILNDLFGYQDFRGSQAEIIARVISGKDTLVIMPTGGGKSLCYQLPALVRNGTAIVVSPLISLMKDQVDSLLQLGIRAAFLNSALSASEAARIEQQLLKNELDLVYVAPERLVTERMLALLKRSQLALFAIDEAHCVSQWGHDFRPEYRQLGMLRENFPDVPRIALTATADELTRRDIVEQLQLTNAEIFISGFDRPNIYYDVVEKNNPRTQLYNLLKQHHWGDSCIVYCLSRKKVEETAQWLSEQGWQALPYHAGLDKQIRERNQERFLREDGLVIVATVAFGMGIDKSNVRLVAHLDMPKSLESYYQETGRAGRDNLPAHAWMSYGVSDIVQLRQMLAGSEADEQHKRVEIQKLKAMIGYCETIACRRQVLLNYFGERLASPCGNCDTCLQPKESWDGTKAAQKALSCVYRTGQKFGAVHLIDVLLGEETEKVSRFRHQQLSTFGIGKDFSRTEWQSIFQQLIAMGLINPDPENKGGLALAAESRAVLTGEKTILLRKEKKLDKPALKKEKKSATVSFHDAESKELWNELRACRAKIAQEQNVPSYVIFHDSTLMEMIAHRPQSLAEFKRISGVGENKLARYGEIFLAILKNYPREGAPAPAIEKPPAKPVSKPPAKLPPVEPDDDYYHLDDLPPAKPQPQKAAQYLEPDDEKLPPELLAELMDGEEESEADLEKDYAHTSAPALPAQRSSAIPPEAAETVRMFLAGRTVDGIAELLNLKLSTVYAHLATGVESGRLDLFEVVPLTLREINHIEQLIQQLSPTRAQSLKIVFDKLDGKISYDLLNCVKASVLYQNRNNG